MAWPAGSGQTTLGIFGGASLERRRAIGDGQFWPVQMDQSSKFNDVDVQNATELMNVAAASHQLLNPFLTRSLPLHEIKYG
jgi:hypothetical protein